MAEKISKATSRSALLVGTLIMGLGITAMMASGGRSGDGGGTNQLPNGPLVETVTAEVADGLYRVEAPGRLQSRQTLSIVGEIAGKVTYVNPAFVMGGRLAKGDVLFRVNVADYEASVASAKAGVASANASLVRAKLENTRRLDLVKKGAVSEAARDETVANLASAEAVLLQAQAQLRQAEENLSRTVVRAPFPALVTQENVSLDTYVGPGQVLATIIDTRAAELVAGLSPQEAAAVSRMYASNGGSLAATARPNEGSVGSKRLVGTVDQFSPAIDAASRSALVVAVFPDAFVPENAGRIFANDFMTLEIEVRSDQQVWSLPAGSVRKNSYVWSVEKGTLIHRNVTVIRADGDRIFVTASDDLSGAKIMVTLLSEETEGMQVRSTPISTVATAK